MFAQNLRLSRQTYIPFKFSFCQNVKLKRRYLLNSMIFIGTHIVFFAVSLSATESYEHPTTCSFEKLVDSKLFLDKTMFIEKFLTSKHEHIAMTGPRQFGKSAMLDTLRRFLQVEVAENGTRIEKTKFKRLFEKTDIFKKNQAFFTRHFAQYPVIYFNFSKISYRSFDDFAKTFVRMVNEEFARHRYLLKSKALSVDDEKIFTNYSTYQLWTSHRNVTDTPNPWAFMLGGRELSILLAKFFGRKPIALIDNYDAFKTSIVGPKFLESNYELDNMLEVLGLFVGAIATDNYAQRSLLTGMTRFGAVYRDYATYLQVMTIFDSASLSPYWGISEAELLKLAGKAGRLAEIDSVKESLCGYYVSGTADKMCGMSSVFRFMETGQIEPYLKPRLGLKNMEKLLAYSRFGSYLDDALEGGVKIQFLKKITGWHLLKFRDTMMANDEGGQKPDFFLQFLTESGYFTVRSKEGENEKGFTGEIVVPNKEIREDVRKAIYSDKFIQDKNRALSWPTAAKPPTTKSPK